MDTYNATPVAQPTESIMTVGEWMLTTFLMMIPCVGLIMMFIWAFGDTKNTKPTKSNYAKAMFVSSKRWQFIFVFQNDVVYSIFALLNRPLLTYFILITKCSFHCFP